MPDLETVVVGVGGGGLVSGHRDGARRPRARRRGRAGAVAGVSAPGSRRASSVRVETDTIADGLAPPFAGELPLEICRGRVETVLVTEDEIADGMRFLYARAKLACEPAGAAAAGAVLAGKVEAGPGRGRDRLGRQRGAETGRCYLERAMKADIHPEYVVATVTCSCGNTFQTRSTKPELHVEICSQCHPFYTGKQKLMDTGGRVERFQRRLERAGQARRG